MFNAASASWPAISGRNIDELAPARVPSSHFMRRTVIHWSNRNDQWLAGMRSEDVQNSRHGKSFTKEATRATMAGMRRIGTANVAGRHLPATGSGQHS